MDVPLLSPASVITGGSSSFVAVTTGKDGKDEIFFAGGDEGGDEVEGDGGLAEIWG